MTSPLLQFRGVEKRFDGGYALRAVTFTVNSGDCVAVCGENGAGKSTLMKILSGVWPDGSYGGDVFFEGKRLSLRSPLDARRAGISIIHQELCLFSELTVAENLFLTEEFPYDGAPSQKMAARVRWRALEDRARQLFADLGFGIDPRAKVGDLSVAQRQCVEIARAFHHRAKVLILDEPTSALSRHETEALLTLVERMRLSGMTFLYISHKLDEVFRICNRVLVLRDGQSVADLKTKNTDETEIVRHMVGRPVGQRAPIAARRRAEAAVLEVRGVSHWTTDGKKLLGPIDFSLSSGEILGLAGLMGAGRSELLRSILGVLPGRREGEVRLDGQVAVWNGIAEALDAGVAFVPEDRKKDGLFLGQGIGFNLSISSLSGLLRAGRRLDPRAEDSLVADLMRRLRVKGRGPGQAVRTLSGGNQQKVLLGKVMARSPKVLFLDEPTRGIDVGAKEEIYQTIRELASGGVSVLVVSSELPEILALSDRVLVMREGRLAGDLPAEGLSQEAILGLAAGVGVKERHASV